jgi:hypothetical protein
MTRKTAFALGLVTAAAFASAFALPAQASGEGSSGDRLQ